MFLDDRIKRFSPSSLSLSTDRFYFYLEIRDKMYFGSIEISIAIHHDAASLTRNPEREREILPSE